LAISVHVYIATMPNDLMR